MKILNNIEINYFEFWLPHLPFSPPKFSINYAALFNCKLHVLYSNSSLSFFSIVNFKSLLRAATLSVASFNLAYSIANFLFKILTFSSASANIAFLGFIFLLTK